MERRTQGQGILGRVLTDSDFPGPQPLLFLGLHIALHCRGKYPRLS